MSARDPARSTETPASEPLVSTLLRVGAYAITAAVFAWPLSVPEGTVAAGLGAALGSIAGRVVGATRARTHAVLLACLAAFGIVVVLRELVVGSAAVAASLGPSVALRAGEAVVFGLGAIVVATAVRTLSARHRSLAALEATLIALAFASLVVAHRNGAIHRPYELADPMLSAGWDPTVVLLAVGACAGLVIGLLLLSERSLIRSAFHLGVVAVLLLLVFGTTAINGPPPPPEANDGLGLRDDPDREARERESRGRGGGAGGPDFQDEYDQSQSQVPLAVVLLHDDYSPPTGVYYFRQEAFSQYNGRRLISATISGVDDDTVTGFPTREIDIAGAPDTGSYRSTVETTVGLLADHPRPFGLESPIRFTPVQNPDRGRFRRTYRVRSAVLTSDEWGLLGRDAGDASWGPDILAHYTRAPEDPRYRALAERVVSELPDELRRDPLAQAVAVTRWLGHEGIYSLRSRHAGAEDPTADFLFGDLTGYCVHFSHATVFLLRALGLPARVATGYMVPESSRAGGSAIMVAGQNSHAWPEIYLDGVGWVVVDVSPERSLDPPPPPADEQLQQLLAEMLRGLRPISADGSEAGQPLAEMARQLRGPIAMGFLGLVAFALVLGYAVKTWRRLAPSFARGAALPRVVYRSALDVLSERGVRREWGESREAFAARVRGDIPSLATLTARHGSSAWGGRVAPSDPELRRAISALHREVARIVPWWRRALGLLNPYSWLLSR